jgi:predicted site-specific integrase-resolvase
LRLQKYPAKGSLHASTFAAQRRGTTVKIGYARVSTQDQKLEAMQGRRTIETYFHR